MWLALSLAHLLLVIYPRSESCVNSTQCLLVYVYFCNSSRTAQVLRLLMSALEGWSGRSAPQPAPSRAKTTPQLPSTVQSLAVRDVPVLRGRLNWMECVWTTLPVLVCVLFHYLHTHTQEYYNYDTDPISTICIPLFFKAAMRKGRNVLPSYQEVVRVSLVKIPWQVSSQSSYHTSISCSVHRSYYNLFVLVL